MAKKNIPVTTWESEWKWDWQWFAFGVLCVQQLCIKRRLCHMLNNNLDLSLTLSQGEGTSVVSLFIVNSNSFVITSNT